MEGKRGEKFLDILENAARTVFTPAVAQRPSPSETVEEGGMDDQERRHAAALMRVNHCGEVCAQALYQAQALFARDPGTAEALQEASDEEIDHLAWTAGRVHELGGRESRLNPLWYAGSFLIGAGAAILGDRVSLGFVAETERQVSEHLRGHADRLPAQDAKSRAIVHQMEIDETAHAEQAEGMGAADLPFPVRGMMRLAGRVMTTTSYWV